MTIHIRKLPQFSLYAAHADEFGVTVFGACRDEAVNNLTDALAARGGQAQARQTGVVEASQAEQKKTSYERDRGHA